MTVENDFFLVTRGRCFPRQKFPKMELSAAQNNISGRIVRRKFACSGTERRRNRHTSATSAACDFMRDEKASVNRTRSGGKFLLASGPEPGSEIYPTPGPGPGPGSKLFEAGARAGLHMGQ